MIITLVVDTFQVNNNGTTISATRFADALIARGHTVRVVACGSPDQGEQGTSGARADAGATAGPEVYWVPELVIPLATRLAHAQHTLFAKPEKSVLTQAITGADVVHVYQPWALGRAAQRIASKLGVPVIAAFHVQPENITYNLGLGRFRPAAHLVYSILRLAFYRHFTDIHCPSTFIAAQLRHHGYRARLHVISNGVNDAFRPGPARDDVAPYRVLMVGRLSAEKRQDVLIEAVRRSRHAQSIQVHLAGHGPRERTLRRLGARLPNPPIFGYYNQEQLIELMRASDLYVHASDVEIEGLSCLEAISCGVVPVISDSKQSATGQFALGPQNLFRTGDPTSLAERIDAWLDDPEGRLAASSVHARYARLYSLERSVDAIEKVYETAGIPPTRPNPYLRGRLFRAFSTAFYYVIAVPLLFVWIRVILGVRIKGRRRLPVGGALTVCNHVHTLDSAIVGLALFPRRVVVTSLPENLSHRWYGGLVKILGGVPVPESFDELGSFFDEMELLLARGRLVHFFPEGELNPYDTELREFKRGAFHLAAKARVPVVPLSIRFSSPRGWRRVLHRRPTMDITIGEPIPPAAVDLRNDRELRMVSVRKRMSDVITRAS